jgi:predicted HTH domain antitoxin
MEQLLFQIKLPEEFMPFLDKINGNSIEKKIQVSLAINLYINKTVSLAKAAELAGETLTDFIEILKEQDIPWGEYTQEHKNQDDKVIKKIMKELEV